MIKELKEILNKTYDNPVLRRTTVPLFMSNPGTGKTTILKEFAKERGVDILKITLSQRMPNEVISMLMPNQKTGKIEVYDSLEISALKPGSILFFDEVFNGVLKQTLDSMLNFTEDRITPSGKHVEDIMIIAASNPQGLINLTPQIKERFIRYDLKFNAEEYQTYMKDKYGMPEDISGHLCTLINKEKFEHVDWNYVTPRSLEKSINQIGCELKSPYDDVLMPFLKQELVSPMNIKAINIKKGGKVEYLEILKLLVKAANEPVKEKKTVVRKKQDKPKEELQEA